LRQDLGLGQRSVVDPDIVDPTGEVGAKARAIIAGTDIEGRVQSAGDEGALEHTRRYAVDVNRDPLGIVGAGQVIPAVRTDAAACGRHFVFGAIDQAEENAALVQTDAVILAHNATAILPDHGLLGVDGGVDPGRYGKRSGKLQQR